MAAARTKRLGRFVLRGVVVKPSHLPESCVAPVARAPRRRPAVGSDPRARQVRSVDSGAGGTPVPRERRVSDARSEEHTSELQSRLHLVCRLLLEKKNK